MSLLNSASLCVTPNGYKAGTLYSVIPNTTLGDMTVVRATTATRVNSAGLIESVANNVPRLDYSNGTCPSILVEPQRTNLLQYSEQINNAAWIKDNSPTITTNIATAPDGTISADGIQAADASNFKTINQTFAVSSNSTITASVFIKKETSETYYGGLGIIFYGTSTKTCFVAFKAVTGEGAVIGSNLTAIIKVDDYGNYWRLSVTTTDNGSNASLDLYYYATLSTTFTGLSAGAGSVRTIWGLQLEAASYPTSYIPTTSAAVTRNADVISKTGISALIGQTEGTIFIDFDIDNILSQTIDPVIFSFTGTNYIRLFTTGVISYFDSNVVSLSSSSSIINNGQNKIAVNYKNNDFSIYANGVLVATNNSGAVVAKSQISLNYIASTIYNPSIFYNLVTLFPTKLTGAECISLTT